MERCPVGEWLGRDWQQGVGGIATWSAYESPPPTRSVKPTGTSWTAAALSARVCFTSMGQWPSAAMAAASVVAAACVDAKSCSLAVGRQSRLASRKESEPIVRSTSVTKPARSSWSSGGVASSVTGRGHECIARRKGSTRLLMRPKMLCVLTLELRSSVRRHGAGRARVSTGRFGRSGARAGVWVTAAAYRGG